MSQKYPHLLSPIKVRNTIFRNRLIAATCKPHYVQGSEAYPTEAIITHYANKARGGAALVTCGGSGFDLVPIQTIHDGRDRYRAEGTRGDTPAHNQEAYLSQLADAIHYYGALASIGLMVMAPPNYDVSGGMPIMLPSGGRSAPQVSEEIPLDLLDEIADKFALQAAFVKQLGFDMVALYMQYRAPYLGRFLSPMTNKRTDQFGGSVENRARFPIMVADRIKQRCGQDFLIEASMSGSEPLGGYTLEDGVKYANLFAGHIDLLQLRAGEIDPQHTTGFTLERTPFLHMAEAVKKSGADISVVTIGGFIGMGTCENVISSGKADFIGMARAWISNPDFGRLAYEDRGEDVVPCIRCNKCLLIGNFDPFLSVCSVNPTYGYEHKIERMIDPPTRKKKIAVVGGGPAGMEAALVASGRGHQVTLYEKSDSLGGLLKTSKYVSFKWPMRAFKNYLVKKINKSDVTINLNTEVTAEVLKAQGYDVVFVAIGASPVVPDFPGVDGRNVVFAQDIYGNEDALAENVVVIGGGETGVETGMYLVEKGHKVTVLEMLDKLAPNAATHHYYSIFKSAWEKLENFNYILQARCTGIEEDKVTYIDAGSKQHTIEAGSVVIAVGARPNNDLALEFAGAADRFFIIGDCNKVGDLQKSMRSAYSIASTV